MLGDELLSRAREAGVTLTLQQGEGTERLIARPHAAVTPEILAALRDNKPAVIEALRSQTVYSERQVFDLAAGYFDVSDGRRLDGEQDLPGFVARGLQSARELGLVARWSRQFGFISVHDPLNGEWHDLPAKEAPSWAKWEAGERRELHRGGDRSAYNLSSREMEEIWAEEHPEDPFADRGVEGDPD